MTRLYLSLFFFMIFINNLLSSYPPNYEDALKLFQKKEYEASLYKIREVFDSYRNSLEFRLLAASNYLELKDYKNALAHLKYASIDHPNSVEVMILFADVYNQMGQWNQALQALEKAMSLAKQDKTKEKHLRYYYAKTFYYSKNYERAKKITEALIAEDSNFLEALYLDALIYLAKKNFELAEFRFRTILSHSKIEKDLARSIYNNLGYIQEVYAQNQPKNSKEKNSFLREAKRYYELALQIQNDYSIAQDNLARLTRDEK
ncbi:MAG: tetratricopeptide repeat protein [Leptospiraceae bacterium]|nr:tetratricopeptide repeat protein [Leptospiraceae bacterium]MDW7976534.1 tetratricopeptide repeat protein [Leptospiraceae bacterium]